jgi:hypothetical protein
MSRTIMMIIGMVLATIAIAIMFVKIMEVLK